MADGKTKHFKLVLLGNASVGKSCLVVRFAKGEFYENQEPTIGAAFMTQTVNLGDFVCKFEIWDTAGQERYRALAPMYYRGASAAVVVYDIGSKESFEGAKDWVKELLDNVDSITVALAGNKADMPHARAVSQEEVEAYARENGCIFLETSAKTGHNVVEIFTEIAKKLPQQSNDKQDSGGVGLADGQAKAAGGCCG